MAAVLPFSGRPTACDWTNAELAKLFWVKNALAQANLPLETDRGCTDEGDPWFVFCRADGAVLLHIARLGNNYHLFSPVLHQPLIGTSFEELTRTFVSALPVFVHPNAVPGRVVLHPAAMMSMLVATIYFCFDNFKESGQAQAAVPDQDQAEAAAPDSAATVSSQNIDRQQTTGPTQGERSIDRSDALSAVTSQNMALMAVVALIESLIGDESFAFSDEQLADESAALISATEASGESSDGYEQPTFVEPTQRVSTAVDHGAVTHVLVSGQPAAADLAALPASINIGNGLAGSFLVADWSSTNLDLDAIIASGAIVPAFLLTGALWTNGLPNAEGWTDHSGIFTKPNVASALEWNVIVIYGGTSLVIDPASAIEYIHTIGDGVFAIDGLMSGYAPAIMASANSIQSIVLSYLPPASAMEYGSPYLITQTLVLGGGVTAEITPEGSDAQANGTIDITLESDGANPNTVYLAEPEQLEYRTITVTGSQDLFLHETPAIFESSQIDAANFDASLTVAVNLSEASNASMSLGPSNFVVNEFANLALLDIKDGATLDVATSLNTLITKVDADSDSAAPASLAVELQSSAYNSVSISTISAGGIGQLSISSNGNPTNPNEIAALGTPSLSELTISGSGSLTIGSILGVLPDSTNILIDSTALEGSLTIDITGMGGQLGRSVTLMGGAGDDRISNSDPSLAATITGGGGADHFFVAAGQMALTFTDLDDNDKIIVGGQEGSAKCMIVDGTGGTVAEEAGSVGGSLLSAAMAAAERVASEADHQAVLFSSAGSDYIFVDANGDHDFDHDQDAVIHLVGAVTPAELDNVFWVN